MEPERNIEKLLRSFAKYRRTKAADPAKPDPFALHPATRRLLQSEVSRRAGRPVAPAAGGAIWMRWILGGAIAAVGLFILLAQFLPAFHSAAQRGETASALRHLQKLGIAAHLAADNNGGKLPASLDELTNITGDAHLLEDPRTGQPFTYLGRGQNLPSLPPNTVIAYGSDTNDQRAVLFADGSVTLRDSAGFSTLTNHPLEADQLATAAQPPPPAAPAESPRSNVSQMDSPPASTVDQFTVAANNNRRPPAVYRAVNAGEISVTKAVAKTTGAMNQSTQTFIAWEDAAGEAQSQQQNGQQYNRTRALANNAPPLLTHFEWQQNGNAIRIVDADGSVYDGSLVDSGMGGQTPASTQSLPGAVSFQVMGRNQTSQQDVVFTGSYVPIATNATWDGSFSLREAATPKPGSINGLHSGGPTNDFANASGSANRSMGSTLYGSVEGFGGASGGGVSGTKVPAQNNLNNLPTNLATARITGILLESTNRYEINAVSTAP